VEALIWIVVIIIAILAALLAFRFVLAGAAAMLVFLGTWLAYTVDVLVSVHRDIHPVIAWAALGGGVGLLVGSPYVFARYHRRGRFVLVATLPIVLLFAIRLTDIAAGPLPGIPGSRAAPPAGADAAAHDATSASRQSSGRGAVWFTSDRCRPCNLRAGPGTSWQARGGIGPSVAVRVREWDAGWARVDTPSWSGVWIRGDFLRE
jgi:hypothetical protein